MFKLEEIHISEFRGIKELSLRLDRSSFVICGPNGSGKSGVVDAIEFALTGGIKRLSGTGTQGMSVRRHGPHVDKSDDPRSAHVRLKLHLENLDTSVAISRTVASPGDPTIEPVNKEIVTALDEIQSRAEIGLSRRELLRFILVKPGDRAKQIQSLLNLNGIDTVSSNLLTARNKLRAAYESNESQADAARIRLLQHLELTNWNSDDVLRAVNIRRRVLGIEELQRLDPGIKLSAGIAVSDKVIPTNKKSTLRGIDSLIKKLAPENELGSKAVGQILDVFDQLDSEPTLNSAVKDLTFIRSGIERVVDELCPLCDTKWDSMQLLKLHLERKLERAKRAEGFANALRKNGAALNEISQSLVNEITPIQIVASGEPGCEKASKSIKDWASQLKLQAAHFSDVNWLLNARVRIETDWLEVPDQVIESLGQIEASVKSWPEQSKQDDASSYLVTAQDRWELLCDLDEKRRYASRVSRIANAGFEAYRSSVEAHLNELYGEITEDFGDYYRIINREDEPNFRARLTRKANSVEFGVDFYGRGLFPPGAYHSEGHQDGMGVCLYLALMKRLYGREFSFALLDDVVMSIDSGHRRQFCELIKNRFPNTQFVVTTHDQLWARQIKSAQIIGSKSLLHFYGWTIDVGPIVASDEGTWGEIAREVEQERIPAAAATLRRHLEYACAELADGLCAQVRFRIDGRYELGDLYSAVVSALREYYGLAAKAAQSWGKPEEAEEIARTRKRLGQFAQKANVENWAINSAIHYNQWANFSSADFRAVIAAHRELQEAMQCRQCSGKLRVALDERGPINLTCSCGANHLHLIANSN